MNAMRKPAHPGEVRRGWTAEVIVTEAPQRLGVTGVALSRVLSGAAAVSPEMDLSVRRIAAHA